MLKCAGVSELFVREKQLQLGTTSTEILFIRDLMGTDVTKNTTSQTSYNINTIILIYKGILKYYVFLWFYLKKP